MPKQVKSYVHVNQHALAGNQKFDRNDQVITVKTGKSNTYAREAVIRGPAQIEYSGHEKPLLSCGARVAVTTEAPVRCLDRAETPSDAMRYRVQVIKSMIRSNIHSEALDPVIALTDRESGETVTGFRACFKEGPVHVIQRRTQDGDAHVIIESNDKPVIE